MKLKKTYLVFIFVLLPFTFMVPGCSDEGSTDNSLRSVDTTSAQEVEANLITSEERDTYDQNYFSAWNIWKFDRDAERFKAYFSMANQYADNNKMPRLNLNGLETKMTLPERDIFFSLADVIERQGPIYWTYSGKEGYKEVILVKVNNKYSNVLIHPFSPEDSVWYKNPATGEKVYGPGPPPTIKQSLSLKEVFLEMEKYIEVSSSFLDVPECILWNIDANTWVQE